MFMGAYLEGGDFRDEGVRAMRGFLDRVYANLTPADGETLGQKDPKDEETLYWLHRTIKAVGQDIERFSYNTGPGPADGAAEPHLQGRSPQSEGL